MRRFVTLFPAAKNIHLVKDVGQIPFHMQRRFNYKSTLACYNNDDYSYLNNEVKGLNIHFLDDLGKRFFWEKGVTRFLREHSKNIDVLNLYHLKQASMWYGLLYKYLNPKGRLYLKLDFDYKNYNSITFSEVKWKEYLHQKMYARFKRKVDMVSVEAESGYNILKQLDEQLCSKTFLLPNGTDINQTKKTVEEPLFEQKENLMLTVGRIGTEQKNSELLLNALADMDLKNWQIKFAGPVEENFKAEINAFFKNNPDKKSKVHFAGAISDRKKMLQLYKKAKIFCLTSRWEGSPIALAEAQSLGAYVIASDTVAPIQEITKEGKLGSVFESENMEQLKAVLRKAVKKDFYTEPLMNDILAHGKQHDWPLMLEQLDRQIKLADNR